MDIDDVKELVEAVTDRLDAAKIKYTDDSDIDNEVNIDITVEFPCGRDSRRIYIFDEDDLQQFADLEFEKYTLLGSYSAIANRVTGDIEALLTSPSEVKTALRRPNILRSIGLTEQPSDDSATLASDVDASLPQIHLGPTSKTLRTLAQASDPLGFGITIKASRQLTHDSAVELLERLSNALFFSIDADHQIHIALARRSVRRRRRALQSKSQKTQYPKSEYDKAPMALYWYARSADSMPLLQFLAYYQVVEYYFPAYFSAEVSRRIRSVIKHPSFRVDRDADVAKIITALKGNRGSSAPERDQLKATLRECVSVASIEEFLAKDSDRSAAFLTKAKGITSCLLNPENRQADLVSQVADRIYDIRCKIVHTKGDHEDGEVDLLLPYSPEAERLHHDIDLVQFIAQSVLITASKRIEIAA